MTDNVLIEESVNDSAPAEETVVEKQSVDAETTTDIRVVVDRIFANTGLHEGDYIQWRDCIQYIPQVDSPPFEEMDSDSQIHHIRRALRLWLVQQPFNTFDMRQVVGGEYQIAVKDFIVALEALAGMFNRAFTVWNGRDQ